MLSFMTWDKRKSYRDFVFFELIGRGDFILQIAFGDLDIIRSLLVLFEQRVFNVVPILVKVPFSGKDGVCLFVEMLHEFFDVVKWE